MSLSAFTSRLGLGQGRLKSPDAASGEYVFVLGEDEAGRRFELASGDHVQVEQRTDLSGTSLVRVQLRFRVPNDVPVGLAWEASILVDGIKVARLQGHRGRERVSNDLVANVSKLSGHHEVGVRLELISV